MGKTKLIQAQGLSMKNVKDYILLAHAVEINTIKYTTISISISHIVHILIRSISISPHS